MPASQPGPTTRLDRLLEAARLSEDRDAAALNTLRAEIVTLRTRMAALRHLPDGDLLSAGFAQSGGVARWQTRCQAERGKLNLVLAQKLAQLPELEKAAGHSAARRIVLTRLRYKL